MLYYEFFRLHNADWVFYNSFFAFSLVSKCKTELSGTGDEFSTLCKLIQATQPLIGCLNSKYRKIEAFIGDKIYLIQ